VVWAEYAIDTAKSCHAVGIKTVAVTAGYITPEARVPFFEHMDAANVDLKGFTEEFYHKITYSHLQPVLDTLAWLKAETDVWFEVTNLVIPRENDREDEIRAMCGWLLEHCGDEVPVHFTAFHPDFRMTDRPNTPHETLLKAHAIGRAEGLKHVYTGNVNDVEHQSTYCPHCGERVIERNWYELGAYSLRGNRCGHCGGSVAGRFGAAPGDWGRKRVPIDIAAFNRPRVTIAASPQAQRPAMTMTATEAAPILDDEQKQQIHAAACQFVAGALTGSNQPLEDPTLAGAAGAPVAGAYVTLKRQGQLRACTGMLGNDQPLAQALRHAAVTTATGDHRLPPIATAELPFLDVDVNLLFHHEPVTARGRDRLAAVTVGRHGLRIQRRDHAGLLLPCVAVEQGWDAVSFLRHVCRKAGLPTTAWEDDETRLFTFESVEFGGPFDPSALESRHAGRRLDDRSFQQIRRHARDNVIALVRGMTPNYYAHGAADGHVAGVILSVGVATMPEPLHFAQLSLRPGVPLQATVFALCEAAARQVSRNVAPDALQVNLTVLTDPAMQGNAAAPDLRGLDPTRRALLLLESNKSCLVFDPSAIADDLLATARTSIDVLTPERAGCYSLEFQSTFDRLVFRSAPNPTTRTGGVRPPAQAGRFYPEAPEALERLVGSLLEGSDRRPESWPLAMVPHAGLRFSGKVAAAVFNRLEIPETVIVIGPKHTAEGVDWAVDPHDAWAIPGATVAGDPALARALAEAIPGLKLDAAAHRAEHAIEVELPFLARLAPETKVVGLAIGGGDWERCRAFATGLAGALRALPSRPLILVSSDMNHFASDVENRRLDAIALEALDRLDPEHLLKTVSEHDISMCGVLPAVIALETLRQLDGLHSCERVAYATSADAGADAARVVGYAGVLVR
jgi:AmmeMemoRadiSam system protein B/AmmeMemoRadiSam system protein A